MSTYVIFNTTSGRITKLITIEDVDPILANLNTEAGEDNTTTTGNADPNYYYVTNTLTTKDITLRPNLSNVATWNTTTITSNGSNVATLGSSLPNPTQITIQPPLTSGIPYVTTTETSGSFSFSTTVAGYYQVTANAFPYLVTTANITAI